MSIENQYSRYIYWRKIQLLKEKDITIKKEEYGYQKEGIHSNPQNLTTVLITFILMTTNIKASIKMFI